MDFLIHCECGTATRVSEGSAGAKLDCACGRTLSVPPLHELRARAGLTAHVTSSPEFRIENLLAAGKLPTDGGCAGCGTATENLVQVRIECERAVRRGGFDWSTLLITWFLPWWILRWREPVEYGKDRVYWLPLPLCPRCEQEATSDRKALRDFFWQMPLYRELLEKYPAPRIDLSGMKGGL